MKLTDKILLSTLGLVLASIFMVLLLNMNAITATLQVMSH